jgi:hypothetical protein
MTELVSPPFDAGVSPVRYLSELRLGGAADQLATGRLPL